MLIRHISHQLNLRYNGFFFTTMVSLLQTIKDLDIMDAISYHTPLTVKSHNDIPVR